MLEVVFYILIVLAGLSIALFAGLMAEGHPAAALVFLTLFVVFGISAFTVHKCDHKYVGKGGKYKTQDRVIYKSGGGRRE